MKKTALFTLFVFLAFASWSQRVWQAGVVKTGINVRGAVVTVGQLTVNTPVAGKVIVRFDGKCYSSAGDRIVLAASNIADWDVNDGNVTTEVTGLTQESKPFSHTRVYDVTPGNHTFYAVAENYVETAGTGIASIYGSLTVEYYQNGAGQPTVNANGIIQVNSNLRGAPVALSQLTVNAPTSGYVMVRFDGTCISSPGDRIVLAASNVADWGSDDGNVTVEAYNTNVDRNGFSHVRYYSVAAGNHTFYAVGQNYVELDGSGKADVYGTLTAVFYPGSSPKVFGSGTGIQKTDIDVRTAPVSVAQISLTVPEAGQVAVNFAGNCISTPGDLIVLAASNTLDYWGVNDGNIGVQAISTDINENSFSHTRVFDVTAGTHTFYAVSQNYVYTAGTGVASIYANLTATFFASAVTATGAPTLADRVKIYPNPTADRVQVTFPDDQALSVTMKLLDVKGQILNIRSTDQPCDGLQLDISRYPAGTYFVELSDGESSGVKQVIRK